MDGTHPAPDTPLRVFCLEDNPLIAFHLEQMIEDLGHVFAGSLESFADLKSHERTIAMDCALVDIDLADGSSGPSAVAWLLDKGIPSAFVTGQEVIANSYSKIAVGVVVKPITDAALAAILRRLRSAISKPSSLS